MAAMRALPANAFEDRPMGEMNTTPLIDVMLVLLIMFIMTIPIATNSLEVSLPSAAIGPAEPNPVRNKIAITPDGRIFWNESLVTPPQLAGMLSKTRRMPVEPQLQFEPDGQASYALTAQVTDIISRSGVTNFGFVGNERYAGFGRAEGTATPR